MVFEYYYSTDKIVQEVSSAHLPYVASPFNTDRIKYDKVILHSLTQLPHDMPLNLSQIKI